MSDLRLLLPEPSIDNFKSIKQAILYEGYSSNTLVAYVNGEIGFVTLGAKFDYIDRISWKKLLPEIVEMINCYGKKAPEELHKRHIQCISKKLNI